MCPLDVLQSKHALPPLLPVCRVLIVFCWAGVVLANDFHELCLFLGHRWKTLKGVLEILKLKTDCNRESKVWYSLHSACFACSRDLDSQAFSAGLNWAEDGEPSLEDRVTAIPTTYCADSPFPAWSAGLSLDPREALKQTWVFPLGYAIKPVG